MKAIVRCHETVGEVVVDGSSWRGLTRANGRIAGKDAPAYIHNSIEEPEAYTVEGFQEDLMPPDFKEQLTSQELEAVIAYLLTLE